MAGYIAPVGPIQSQLDAESPEKLTGDINEGLRLFMGRGKCSTCHMVDGNPRALGVAGPNLTKVASRYSIAAGWLNHRADDGTIDTEKQYENFVRWIKETDVVKPGNLMWKANGGSARRCCRQAGVSPRRARRSATG